MLQLLLPLGCFLPRKAAVATNAPTYEGSVHAKCGTTKKYTNSRGCVYCKTHPSIEHCARINARYHELRLKALKIYNDGPVLRCRCCHETILQMLHLDHIDGKGAEHRAAMIGTIWHWLAKNNYPPGFQVLCAGCNSSKARNRYCAHELERGYDVNGQSLVCAA